MKKKKLLTLCFALFSCFFAVSEPDNGKFLPDFEILQPNHVFFELGGGLSFPVEFYSQGNIAMTSYGANFFAGAGYNWSGWLLGFAYTHDMWGEGKGSYALMENFRTNIVEFRFRRLLTKNSVSWLPSWLEIVPGAGLGVNFITTDYYPSKRAKDEGRMNSVKLFDEGANCFFYRLSLETSFFLGTDMAVPFLGVDYNAFYDTSIGGGFAGYARAYIGIRAYPFGVVNDIQRISQKKKEQNLEQKKIEKEQIESWPAPSAKIELTPKEGFTPDDDGIDETAVLFPSVKNFEEEPESWKITILDSQNHEFKTWTGKGALPENLEWNGRSDSGELVFSRNIYTVNLTVVPSHKDQERTGVKEVTADNSLKTGILMQVIIPNKKWKIIVNTIHFDADKATFDRIPAEQRQENIETLDSIARQIKEHGEVSVLVEGYANNVTNTEREDREELVPLSNLRAKVIADSLIERGLKQELLASEGKGGANPIAEWKDRQNWWKNRRVEFIVTRQE
ncbi:OmpA family protein [Treponema sp.]|uniref:OmpA family protein n=1 Tax=Treponema sp. TaxID=166 RepID=UPI00388DA0B6